MSQPRVVITGMGAVCPLGDEIEAIWSRVLNGDSGIAPITKFDASKHASQIAGEVRDFQAELWVEPRDAAYMDEFIAYGAAAATKALRDSGILETELSRREIGVCLSSAAGGMGLISKQDRILQKRGPRAVSPLFIPFILPDSASGYVSIRNGLQGPNHTVVSACATGANSIGDAFLMIQRGQVKAMVAGGSDALINDLVVAGFSASRALSTRNSQPQQASRPFDAERDGFVIAEGGAALVLEEREHALARGAKIHGEIVGYATNADAFHMTQPHPDGSGARWCMESALAMAGIGPSDIGYINAHGTSTKFNDSLETAAVKAALGPRAYEIPMSSTKSMTGHLLGAAGALEAIFSLLAMSSGKLPPTINLTTPDPQCDLDYVPNEARTRSAEFALSNSFGFGGHNATLVFKAAN